MLLKKIIFNCFINLLLKIVAKYKVLSVPVWEVFLKKQNSFKFFKNGLLAR